MLSRNRSDVSNVMQLPRPRNASIRKFALYGEEPRKVEDRLIHFEDISERSNPNWVVRPHVHDNLCHVLVIQSGAGVVATDLETANFDGFCLILIPPRVAHSFRFDPACKGVMLTLATALIRDLSQSEQLFEQLFVAPSCISIPTESRFAKLVNATLKNMAKELTWSKTGYRAVVESCLLSLLVVALRASDSQLPSAPVTHGRDSELICAFRTLIEENFKRGMQLHEYAAALRISPTRLRKACAKVTHQPPLQLVQERTLLECKRLLLYSSMTVAEIGYAVGFSDPAYFSRFFAKREGESPTAFRERRAPV
jgi:AraC family transcriptional activator of pobA